MPPMPGRVDRMGNRAIGQVFRVQHDVQFLPYLQPAISSMLPSGNIGNAFFCCKKNFAPAEEKASEAQNFHFHIPK